MGAYARGSRYEQTRGNGGRPTAIATSLCKGKQVRANTGQRRQAHGYSYEPLQGEADTSKHGATEARPRLQLRVYARGSRHEQTRGNGGRPTAIATSLCKGKQLRANTGQRRKAHGYSYEPMQGEAGTSKHGATEEGPRL